MLWQQGRGNYRPFPPSWCLALPPVCWGRELGTSLESGWARGCRSMKRGAWNRVSYVKGALMGRFSCQFVNTGVRQCRTFWIMRHNLFVVQTDSQNNCCPSVENSLCPKGKIKDVFPTWQNWSLHMWVLKIPTSRSRSGKWRLSIDFGVMFRGFR